MIDTVLIHAFPLDSRMWNDCVGHLAPTAEVYTPDLPGFGGSAEPLPASVDDMAASVKAFIEEQELENVVLGGLSMGGYVAMAYWRLYGAENVQALILADTRANPDDELARARRHKLAKMVEAKGTEPLVEQVLPGLLAPSASDALVARVRSICNEQRPEGVAAALHVMASRPDSTPLLETIDVPVALLCGTEDAVTPAAGMREMSARIPDATWFPIRGAGHLSNLENPEQFNAALTAFLMGLS